MDQLSDMKMALDATFWLRSIQMLKDPYADALGGMPPGSRDNGQADKDSSCHSGGTGFYSLGCCIHIPHLGLFGIIAKELELFSHYNIKPIFVSCSLDTDEVGNFAARDGVFSIVGLRWYRASTTASNVSTIQSAAVGSGRY